MTWWSFVHCVLPCLSIPLVLLVLVGLFNLVDTSWVGSKNPNAPTTNNHPDVDRSNSESWGPYNPISDSYFEAKWEKEERIKTVRRESQYLSDEEIIDRHSGSWGDWETKEVIKESREPTFLWWLLGG